MEGTQYLRLLRRNWLIFVVAIGAAVGLGYLAYQITPAQYRTTVAFYVQSAPRSKSPDAVYEAELLSQARAQVYRQLPSSPNVTKQLRRDWGVDLPAAKLRAEIVTTAPAGNVLVHITITDPDQRRARVIAFALEKILPRDVASLQSAAGLPVTTRLRAFGGSANSPVPLAPSRKLYLGLGLLAGLMLALLASVVRERVRHRVQDDGDVRAAAGVGTVTFSSLRHRSSENLRRLLDIFSAPAMAAVADGRPIAVVPLGRADRAAYHIMQFAAGIAARGLQVTLLDGDLLEQWVSKVADIAGNPGLTDILEGDGTIASVAHQSEQAGLLVVPAGTNRSQSPLRFGEPRMAEVLADSGKDADLVLLATPPVLSRSAVVWPAKNCVDAILFVDRKRVSKDSLRAAAQVLEAVNTRLVGIVLFSGRVVANRR